MDWLSLNNIAREVVAWLADTSLRAVMLALLASCWLRFFAEVRPHSTPRGRWFWRGCWCCLSCTPWSRSPMCIFHEG